MIDRCFTGLLGLLVCGFLLGCGSGANDSADSQSGAADSATAHEEHDHSAEGPHGGHMIVLGDEEYHAELTHDEATHAISVYLLDSSGKVAVSSGPAEITLQVFKDGDFSDYTLKAAEGDGAFSLVDEGLCDLLLHAENVKGRLNVTVAGKEYVGMIDHAAHDHDGHDEDGHDEDGHDHAGHDEDGHDHDGHDH